MKRLMLAALLMVAPFAVSADVIDFNWIKPDPAWEPPGPQDPTWVIDEYRIYCNGNLVRTAMGYNTEATNVDLPDGDYICFMRSYSAGADAESADSNTVSFPVPLPVGSTVPNAPGSVTFTYR